VFRLKSLSDRMSFAMSERGRPHQICIQFDDPIGRRFGQSGRETREIDCAGRCATFDRGSVSFRVGCRRRVTDDHATSRIKLQNTE